MTACAPLLDSSTPNCSNKCLVHLPVSRHGWADDLGTELVSFALISEDGQHRFYAECAFLPPSPTRFVAEVAYPLLQRGAAALDGPALCEALRTFLRTFTPAYVLADYPNDIRLLHTVLAGDGADSRSISGLVATVMDKEGIAAEWVEA